MAGVHHQPRILAGGPQHAPANVCF
jgi:hypothetical protein